MSDLNEEHHSSSKDKPDIQQDIDGNENVQNYGDHNRIFYKSRFETNIRNQYQYLPKTRPISNAVDRFLNFIKAFLCIFVVMIAWFIMGFFANFAFPTGYAFSLLMCSLRGDNALWEKVSESQEEIAEIPDECFKLHSDDRQEVIKLNKYESRIWLITDLIETLTAKCDDPDWNIAIVLDELERKREILLSELESRKHEEFPLLVGIQNIYKYIFVRSNLRDYKYVERILDEIIGEFVSVCNTPSPEDIEAVLSKLENILLAKPSPISKNKLKLLDKVFRISNWIKHQEFSGLSDFDGISLSSKVVADTIRNKYHYEDKCPALGNLKKKYYENSEDVYRVQFFHDAREAHQAGFDRCGSCDKIKLAREKNSS